MKYALILVALLCNSCAFEFNYRIETQGKDKSKVEIVKSK